MTRELSGSERIVAERFRQMQEEKWTAEHDDNHAPGQLAAAAVAYLVYFYGMPFEARKWWPFEDATFKPGRVGDIRNLEKAGALVAAEIDRELRLGN